MTRIACALLLCLCLTACGAGQGEPGSVVVVGILLSGVLCPLLHVQSECLLAILGTESNTIILGQLIHVGQTLGIFPCDEDINAFHNGTGVGCALPFKQIVHGQLRIVADHEVYAGTSTNHDIVLVIDHDVVA